MHAQKKKKKKNPTECLAKTQIRLSDSQTHSRVKIHSVANRNIIYPIYTITRYENTPIQILQPKKEHFPIKNSNIVHISVQNIDCEYSLEPPRRG